MGRRDEPIAVRRSPAARIGLLSTPVQEQS